MSIELIELSRWYLHFFYIFGKILYMNYNMCKCSRFIFLIFLWYCNRRPKGYDFHEQLFVQQIHASFVCSIIYTVIVGDRLQGVFIAPRRRQTGKKFSRVNDYTISTELSEYILI